jgi:hypothetical protein
MKEWMDATEARKLADSKINSTDQEDLNSINNYIHIHASNGYTGFSYNKYVSNKVVETLKAKGYKVERHSDQREGSHTSISW